MAYSFWHQDQPPAKLIAARGGWMMTTLVVIASFVAGYVLGGVSG